MNGHQGAGTRSADERNPDGSDPGAEHAGDDELPSAVAAYLEAIFELDEDDIAALQARIAERLGVTRPAVSEMVRKLTRRGMVVVERGQVRLTAEGLEHAERRVRRHRIAERFLTDVLGLGWARAHVEAEAWEKVMSRRTEEAMARVLGAPTTCPHGNPIPGSDWSDPLATPLEDLAPGDGFTVVRITEQLEFVPGMLESLEQAGMQPGARGTVISTSADGSFAIEVSDNATPRPVSVAGSTASRILVQPSGVVG